MPETRTSADPITAALAKMWDGYGPDGADVLRLRATVEAVLSEHRIEPLYAHADNGECGCPVPGEYADPIDDVAYDTAHPEGHGPDGFGLVCSAKIAGYWCPGCSEPDVERCRFETPKDYPAEKCSVRLIIASKLLGGEGSRG